MNEIPTPADVASAHPKQPRQRRRSRGGKAVVPGSRTPVPELGTTASNTVVPGSRTVVPEPGTAPTPLETDAGSLVPGTDPEPLDLREPTVPSSAPQFREPGTTPYVDIAALLDGTLADPPRPTVLKRADGNCLFYPEQVNLVFGDPESGKTWLCLAAAVEVLNNRGRVVVIDLDHNGPAATVRRLVNLGADVMALRDPDRFRYTEPEDRIELMTVVADMADFHPSVVIVDSVGELLPLFGSSSNSADDFTTVHTRVLKPLARTGAAVLAVDHLAKGADSRSHGPGGTAAKRRAIGGISIRVKVKSAFTPGRGGSAVLSLNKDRHGGLRAVCPVGDREPIAGTFRLKAFTDDVLEYDIIAPAEGERNEDESAPVDDIKAVAALDPPPTTVDEARERLSWRKDRAARAVKAWREDAA